MRPIISERPVDRRNQVHVDDVPEPLYRIDARLAGIPVDTDREIVARDSGRRHAHRDGVEVAADRIEHQRSKCVVGGVAPKRVSDAPSGSRIHLGRDGFDVLSQVHQRQARARCGAPTP
jgi:hypothetical protein